MEESGWKIKFYGTRGSIPICDLEYQLFGGNTTCILFDLINAGDSKVLGILDAGTGIRKLGKDYYKGEFGNPEHIFIAFSHFHWDHIQGFPFFAPAYDPKQKISIFAPMAEQPWGYLKQIFEGQMQEKYFPVNLDDMGADFKFLTTGSLEEFKVMQLDKFMTNKHNHPGGAYGYRLEAFGKSVTICTDIEHGDKIDSRVVAFSRNSDILIHEAQYTDEELKAHKGWGHSSYSQALEVAERSNAKELIITHHDPDHDDYFLLEMEAECQKRFPNCTFAREGMEIVI